MKLKPLMVPAAMAAAAILVVVLAMRVRALNGENEMLFRRITRPYAGMYVPAFSSTTTDGKTVSVAGPGRARQVLFVFNNACPYCRASIPAWTRIGADMEAASGRGTAVGVSLDPPDSARAYAARHGLRYPVAVFPDRRTSALYRTRTVPVTMVVDSAGRVLFSRIGELREGPAADSVRAAAGLTAAAPQSR
ncbi:MAG TPA: TlpA disulfide reductase family protein [Longimicrobium sp.]|nr:TlpA disulfide reductase family protein [Longimicrobium sp.]